MYTPLPERTGPVTRNSVAKPLRATLWVYNIFHATFSILVLAGFFYMYTVYHRTGLIPPTPPSPTPPITATALFGGSDSSPGSLWFLWTSATFGGFLFLVASTGMVGVQPENRHRLFLHILLLSALILIEAAMLLISTDTALRQKLLPEDATGFLPKIEQFIDKNAALVKIIGLCTILMQLMGLGAACWLHSLYQTAYEDWLDGIEAAESRANEQLGRISEQAYAGSSTWSARIKGKYGVGASDWDNETSTATAVQSVGLLGGTSPGHGIP